MNIFLKTTLRNICEKKLRTFLIIFSIILSTALVFCSMTLSETLTNIYVEQIKKQTGTADIIVDEGETKEYRYFSMESALTLEDKIDYIVGGIIGHGYYNGNDGEKTVDLYGLNLEDLQDFNPISYAVDPINDSFVGEKIIVGTAFLEMTGLTVGDNVNLTIEDKLYSFEIYAVSNPVGPFTSGYELQAVMPRDTYAAITGAKNGDVRIIGIKLKNIDDKEEVIAELSELYPENSVRDPVSKQELHQRVGTLSTSFGIISAVVVLLSAFIIISSFKVIVIERLPTIGTLRSIGATKKMTTKLILLESGFYSVVGGTLGCLGGIGILHYLSAMMSPHWMEARILFSPIHLAVAFAFALVLSFSASITQIVKASKISIKDIALGSFSSEKATERKTLFLGLLCLVLYLLLPVFVPQKWSMPIYAFCMIIIVVASVLLLPYFIDPLDSVDNRNVI